MDRPIQPPGGATDLAGLAGRAGRFALLRFGRAGGPDRPKAPGYTHP